MYYDAFERIYKCNNLSQDKKAPGEKLNEDREALIKRMREAGYDEEEIKLVTSISSEELEMAVSVVIDESKKKIEKTAQEKGIEVVRSDRPSFYHVAGQPGCGKSAGINAIEDSLDVVPFISEMDVYRTKHPYITEIKAMIAKKHPNDLASQSRDFVSFTSYFADVVELTAISYMISQGYSVIKETTGKNSRGICGMIEALKSIYPQMSASMACMAVAQEVSIDGTVSRGDVMNTLTKLFVEDLNRVGVAIKPVGRGKVPREFSEDTCRKIPGSMVEIAKSGLIDGNFLIVRRKPKNAKTSNEAIVFKADGSECVEKADFIGAEIADRITGEKAKEEEKAHFDKKKAERSEAKEDLERGDISSTVNLYLYPTRTWLKETDGALNFYMKESGLFDIDEVAKWVVNHKMLPQILDIETLRNVGLDNSSDFDVENAKANEKLNEAGKKLGDVVTQFAILGNVDEVAVKNTR